MAQTVDAMNAINAVLEVSTNGTTWSDISGSANAIVPAVATRRVGEADTLDGDTPIVLSGKRSAFDIDVRLVYTETTGEGFELVRAAWESASRLYVRWSPGGQTGDAQYTSSPGILTEFMYPGADGSAAGPIMTSFKIRVGNITAGTVAA